MHDINIKSLEGEILRTHMAKRLSKALRGKRRWIGRLCSSEFSEREELRKHLRTVLDNASITSEVRLMEFYPSHSEEAKNSFLSSKFSEIFGYAVVDIPHTVYTDVRLLLDREDSMAVSSLQSFTSSGKIRLVRERMDLPSQTRK